MSDLLISDLLLTIHNPPLTIPFATTQPREDVVAALFRYSLLNALTGFAIAAFIAW
jgi:hypothetical protein